MSTEAHRQRHRQQQQQQQQLTIMSWSPSETARIDLAGNNKLAAKSKASSEAAATAAEEGTTSSSFSSSSSSSSLQSRRCARCAAAFGRFYNTGAPCPRCRLRVCRQCRELGSGSVGANDWLCTLCHKIQDLRSVSAEWRRTTGRANHRLSALDILKHSIRRAWTINGPPARWSAARKSAEFRLYRSLPIGGRGGYLVVIEEQYKSAKKPSGGESFAKPPIGKAIGKPSPKQNDSARQRSSIPVYRSRSSREFEDIRGPHETLKRSLIPQRYRGSTDDLRRSREDIAQSAPSLIPKLLAPRNKEDRPRRQDSRDDVRLSSLPLPLANKQLNFKSDSNEEIAASSESGIDASSSSLSLSLSTGEVETGPQQRDELSLKMVDESSLRDVEQNDEPRDETDEPAAAPQTSSSKLCAKESTASEADPATETDKRKQQLQQQQQPPEVPGLAKWTDESGTAVAVVVVKRKFSKEELSNDDTDDAPNRRCSSHLSPEASPLSTRSSKYSPRESESEPTPAMPRRVTSERGESSTASQRIRDAITRTRRESNSSAKYESSGSEGVSFIDRLGGGGSGYGESSGISSYVDIARRVKLFGSSGSSGAPIGSCDEVLQRDSATSAGEDEELLARDPSARAVAASQSRVMLRRRRQFDAQGPRRRGSRSHGARSCCGAEELPALRADETEQLTSTGALLDYRRLVFISSDSSSGREEDDADSSCSGSSYLNKGLHHYHHHHHHHHNPNQNHHHHHQQQQQNQSSTSGLEDCDWDYFESGTLKLPQLQPPSTETTSSRDWTCCTAKSSNAASSSSSSSSCCQACGSSRSSARIVPVPILVPIPVPVPYGASEFSGLDRARAVAAASSLINRGEAARLDQSLPLSLRGCDPAWFPWNSKFDSSNLLFSSSSSANVQSNIFPRELSSSTEDLFTEQQQQHQRQPEKEEQKDEKQQNVVLEPQKPDKCETERSESTVGEAESRIESIAKSADERKEEVVKEEDQQQQQAMMFRRSQEQDSRSSSGRSSADSSDLEDSTSSHRFSRVLVVNDDSLTSDNDIEDNDDSDSARENRPAALKREREIPATGEPSADEPVVLRKIRLLDEDAQLRRLGNDHEEDEEDVDDEDSPDRSRGSDDEDGRKAARDIGGIGQEIASYDEIYLASTQDDSENLVLLRSVRSIDPDFAIDGLPELEDNRNSNNNNKNAEEMVEESVSEEEENDDDDDDDDSAVMPDSLEVSMQDLEDSIEVEASEEVARFATSSPLLVEGGTKREEGKTAVEAVEGRWQRQQPQLQPQPQGQERRSGASSPSLSESTDAGGQTGARGAEQAEKEKEKEEAAEQRGGDQLKQQFGARHPKQNNSERAAAAEAAEEALMAKTRKKWQIPASFDIKGIPSTHFLPQEHRRKEHLLLNHHGNPLLSATVDPEELRPEHLEDDSANNNNNNNNKLNGGIEENNEKDEEIKRSYGSSGASVTKRLGAHDERSDRAAAGGERATTTTTTTTTTIEQVGGCAEELPRYRQQRADERRTPTLDQVEFEEVEEEEETSVTATTTATTTTKASSGSHSLPSRRLGYPDANPGLARFNSDISNNNLSVVAEVANKYRNRSLVTITQTAAPAATITNTTITTPASIRYQPVNVITSETTTLLQPSGPEAARRNTNTKKPLPCKRLLTNPEPEVDSGLSVGSASESDDVQSVKNAAKQQQQPIFLSRSHEEKQEQEEEEQRKQLSEMEYEAQRAATRGGPLILEDGLADDDSWVEEISHDEDEASATTATEESSEDEAANNLGDREEELRGYHRQAIDFTLHTIVEESCEESESEHGSASWRRRFMASAATTTTTTTPDLDKYYFFGLLGNNNAGSSRELDDSLSETGSSSAFSEQGLDSLTREDEATDVAASAAAANAAVAVATSGENFLSEFLNIDQDRRDSDGSVGSDSEGRPSPEAQRRKRLVRARGAGRSHSSSLDNLLALAHQGSNSGDASQVSGDTGQESQSSTEGSSTETDAGDESVNSPVYGSDGQFDTIKRKKKKQQQQSRSSISLAGGVIIGAENARTTPESTTREEFEGEKLEEHEADDDDAESSANLAVKAEEEAPKTSEPVASAVGEIGNNSGVSACNSQEKREDEADARAKQTSRDSGFVGSFDDLLQQPRSETPLAAGVGKNNNNNSPDQRAKESSKSAKDENENDNDNERDRDEDDDDEDDRSAFHERIFESQRGLRERLTKIEPGSGSLLSRKDSFNNWSSDEETNLMMSKMRQFFKTMVANNNNNNNSSSNSNVSSNNAGSSNGAAVASSSSSSSSQTSGDALAASSPSPRSYSSASSSSRGRSTLGTGQAQSSNGSGHQQHIRTKPPQLVYFENELTRLMKTVPGIRDEQVREIVEYLSSEDTWSDSYDSCSDYTSSDLEGATAAARSVSRSALQEQISQSCQQIISKFDAGLDDASKQQQTPSNSIPDRRKQQQHATRQSLTTTTSATQHQQYQHQQQQQQQQAGSIGSRDTAFVYQKLVQSFTKMAGDNSDGADSGSTPHSSPPLIAKVMHHIGSRLVALMHEVSESSSTGGASVGSGGGGSNSHAGWRRFPHHRTPSSASTTEDDDSTSDSASTPTQQHHHHHHHHHHQLPRSKSHDPLLLISSNGGHASNGGTGGIGSGGGGGGGGSGGATSMPPESEERGEASDYERFSWRGSFESALMAADSRTKLSLLACSGGDVSSVGGSTSAMAAKRRSAGDLLFNPKSCSREQLDRVRSCGSIGGPAISGRGGSIEEKIWSNNSRRRSSVPDANTRQHESGASAGDEDTEDEDVVGRNNDGCLQLDGYGCQDPRATTLPRGLQMASAGSSGGNVGNPAGGSGTSNSLPRQTSGGSTSMHKAHSVHHFLPQHSAVKSARYRPPGFTSGRSSGNGNAQQAVGPKRAFSAPGLQLQTTKSRRSQQHQHQHQHQQQQNTSFSAVNVSTTSASASADEASLSEACSTPIIGTSSRNSSSHASMDLDDMDRGLHPTRASLSSLGARSDSMASVYSGAGEGRWCGSVAVKGEVEFSLQYDYKQLTFEVHVTQCRDLAPVDVKRNRSDPYVKVYLLPDKSKSGKRKTKVKKHTLNPVFDETLKFYTSLNSLESRTLWLTVWHSDMFGRNDFLGEVRMPLENKIFDDPRPQWHPLQERTEPFDDPVAYKGEVIVGLKFVPPDPTRLERDRDSSEHRKAKKNWSRGALHVLVKEARNLQTRAKNSGTCDPFCKSYLLPDKGRSGKQKTGVAKKSTGSPVWNHTFVYKDVSLQELAERGLELTVWDHDRIASNEFLGGVRFNLGTGKHYGKAVDWMDATGREMSLWQSMLERPNFWVEGAVTLRPNLHNHGKTGRLES